MKKTPRILIVDDEEANREVLSSFLAPQGYHLELAGDGFEALAKLNLGIDLIYLDLMMPGMDGFEVTRRVRKDPDFGDIPIIMVTSMSSKEYRLRSVEAGVNDFISKPIDMVELQIRTKSLLKMKEVQEAFSNEEALDILREGSGRHFESRLVDLFLKNIDEVLAIQKRYRER